MPTDPKLPPQCPESEKVALGVLLIGGQRGHDLFDELSEDDFATYHHVVIFRAMVAARRKTIQAGRPEFKAEMAAAKTWEDGRTAAYFGEAAAAAVHAADVPGHLEIVREKATARRMLGVLVEIQGWILDNVMSVRDIVAHFETDIFRAAEIRQRKDLIPLQAAVAGAMRDLDDRRKPDGKRPISTGFLDLDRAIVEGWRGGQFVVCGARPGVGKTALALSLALAAAKGGTPVLFCSLEMRASELAARVLAMESYVALNHILGTATIDGARMQRLLRAQDDSTSPLFIDDEPSQTMASISAVARRAAKRHGVGMVIVDYLQLIQHEGGKGEPLHVRVGNTSRQMKLLARQLDVPVLCLAQLNRESEGRTGNRPQLSDLRDSGNIEQDADTVILLHAQPYPNGAEVQQITACIDKQRSGPRGDVTLDYRRPVVRFENRSYNN